MKILVLLGFIIWSTKLSGQCREEAQNGSVIINEISQGRLNSNEEFIELLVTGTGGSVNLNGYIIDDNNLPGVDIGNEPGHIRLKDCFGEVKPGTIILLYNDAEPHPGIPTSSSDQVILLPFSNAGCIEYYSDCPDHQSPTYDCGPGESGEWNDFIPMRNNGDVIQVRDRSLNIVSSISFGVQGVFPDQHARSIANMGSEEYVEQSYSLATPGFPNSEENATYIEQLEGSSVYFEIQCRVSADNPNDLVVSVENGIPPYTISSINPLVNDITFNDDFLILKNLPCDTYPLIITDGNGCTSDCSSEIKAPKSYEFFLEPPGSYQVPLTPECIGCEDCCIKWIPETDVSNPSIINPTLSPGQSTVYKLYLTDDNGTIKDSYTFDIEVYYDCDNSTDPCQDTLCNPIDIVGELEKNGFRRIEDMSVIQSSLPSIRDGNTTRSDLIISNLGNTEVTYGGLQFELGVFAAEITDLLSSEGSTGASLSYQFCPSDQPLPDYINADKIGGVTESYLWIYVHPDDGSVYMKLNHKHVGKPATLIDHFVFIQNLSAEELLIVSELESIYETFVLDASKLQKQIAISFASVTTDYDLGVIKDIWKFISKCWPYFRDKNFNITEEERISCFATGISQPDLIFTLGMIDGVLFAIEDTYSLLNVVEELIECYVFFAGPSWTDYLYEELIEDQECKQFRAQVEGAITRISKYFEDNSVDQIWTDVYTAATQGLADLINESPPHSTYLQGRLFFELLTIFLPSKFSKVEKADDAINKITKLDADRLGNRLADMLGGLTMAQKKQFFDDFPQKHIRKRFLDGDLSVEAWEKVIGRAYSTDVPFLEKLSEIMEPTVLNKLSNGEADLDGIIAALVHPHTGASHTFMKQAAEHLDDVKHFINNFDHLSGNGFEDVISSLRNPNFYAQDGASYMLTKLKSIDAAQVSRMEGKIIDADNLDGICANCLFDVELNGGRKLELKSYSKTTIEKISINSKFENQFKAYLADAQNFNSYEYVFNSKKATDFDLTFVKQNFQSLFSKNNHEIFDQIGGAQNSLMQSLGIANKSDFIDAVSDLGDDLYKFIKIE